MFFMPSMLYRSNIRNSSTFSSVTTVQQKFAFKTHDQIVNKNMTITEPLRINSSDSLLIKNSFLNFSEVDGLSQLIYNEGNLTIINSTILTNVSLNYSNVIENTGVLTVINSSFMNLQKSYDLKSNTLVHTTAIYVVDGYFTLVGTSFENYDTAVIVGMDPEKDSHIVVTKIIKNHFNNCPYGIVLNGISNTIVADNTFINSIAKGISGKGKNVTLAENYIYNDRNLLQGSSESSSVSPLFEVTLGIGFSGNNSRYINNTIINTFKGFYIYKANHFLIENNVIVTTGKMEGELQIQSGDYFVIRNNTLVNQWDPIEIYNSRHMIIEKNDVKSGSSGISVENVEYLRNITPENITIRYNILTDTPFNSVSGGRNVYVYSNVFINSNLFIDTGSENVFISENTFNNGHLIIMDSSDIIISNNKIVSYDIGFINFNNENITLVNNEIYWFLVIQTPEIIAGLPFLILLAAGIAILVLVIILAVRKIRKWRRSRKQNN